MKNVVIKAPSAKALFGGPSAYFDPERPFLSPEDAEREAKLHPEKVNFECPICHVTTKSEKAFWLHAEPCVKKWWKTLSLDGRNFAGASVVK